MGITTTALTKVSVGTTASFSTSTAYAGDTWTLIGGVSDVGTAGSEAEIVVSKDVAAVYARKLKGQRDNGTLDLVVERDASDVGYIALVAAEASSSPYNFKIELNDKPAAGASPKNSFFYFSAIVASKKNNFGDANTIVTTTFSLAINGALLEVAASAT